MSQSLCSKALISVRLVVMDHYIASPIHSLDSLISDFKGTPVRKVPVLRVFGSTPAGQTCCLHLHGIFPYMFIVCAHAKRGEPGLCVQTCHLPRQGHQHLDEPGKLRRATCLQSLGGLWQTYVRLSPKTTQLCQNLLLQACDGETCCLGCVEKSKNARNLIG